MPAIKKTIDVSKLLHPVRKPKQKRDIPADVESAVFRYLANSCQTESDAEDKFGVSTDDVIQIMLENDFERCECGWWQPNRELYDIDDKYLCYDCLKDYYNIKR